MYDSHIRQFYFVRRLYAIKLQFKIIGALAGYYYHRLPEKLAFARKDL